jgi:hypothetical protein
LWAVGWTAVAVGGPEGARRPAGRLSFILGVSARVKPLCQYEGVVWTQTLIVGLLEMPNRTV